ncbi:uncharacterized protein N7496_005303 [Penicillium cataractarum]|uniref:Aminoglycoside phosphotransferase domain-containing protein n=1 Tax=Penicillium cataractarum TaxID=2100454 RepID=A0A9W9SHQ7_9EURO|nr:uncharacterized protein N7496_005303 [Penicillium cataractarum]KAJ5377894.1 hypothetical protein N7496_005303 [Penicillium cataractarum]
MASPLANDPERVARIMLSWHSLDLVSCKKLQTLWAGYGSICAITARATTEEATKYLGELCDIEPRAVGATYPLILKLILPPRKGAAQQDEGHLRKMLSYEVEQTFYNDVAPLLGDGIAVAKCLASTRQMKGKRGEAELNGLLATLMVDLTPKFPVSGGKRGALNRTQVHGALEWLACFHRRSWGLRPDNLDRYVLPPLQEQGRRRSSGSNNDGLGQGLWLNGGYTYLATRQSEYASLTRDAYSEWSDSMCKAWPGCSMSVAEMAASFLTPRGRPIESYIHGDVKSENLFTTRDGDRVAFFDFQYVGLGLGVCDLAKLFTCSVPLEMLVESQEHLPERLMLGGGERHLLKQYYNSLLRDSKSDFYEWAEFERHWETALVDWCRFQASWGFWGNTEWLGARVRSILDDNEWRHWILENTLGQDP